MGAGSCIYIHDTTGRDKVVNAHKKTKNPQKKRNTWQGLNSKLLAARIYILVLSLDGLDEEALNSRPKMRTERVYIVSVIIEKRRSVR